MPRPLSEVKGIVIHHSVTRDNVLLKDLEEIRAMHLYLGYKDIGYHYIVERINGKPYLKVGRDKLAVGAHCIPDKYPYYNQYMNYYWLGLCILGDFSNKAPDNEETKIVCNGIREIVRKCGFKLSRKSVIGHRDASYTECPGKYTMAKIYKELKI